MRTSGNFDVHSHLLRCHEQSSIIECLWFWHVLAVTKVIVDQGLIGILSGRCTVGQSCKYQAKIVKNKVTRYLRHYLLLVVRVRFKTV